MWGRGRRLCLGSRRRSSSIPLWRYPMSAWKTSWVFKGGNELNFGCYECAVQGMATVPIRELETAEHRGGIQRGTQEKNNTFSLLFLRVNSTAPSPHTAPGTSSLFCMLYKGFEMFLLQCFPLFHIPHRLHRFINNTVGPGAFVGVGWGGLGTESDTRQQRWN